MMLQIVVISWEKPSPWLKVIGRWTLYIIFQDQRLGSWTRYCSICYNVTWTSHKDITTEMGLEVKWLKYSWCKKKMYTIVCLWIDSNVSRLSTRPCFTDKIQIMLTQTVTNSQNKSRAYVGGRIGQRSRLVKVDIAFPLVKSEVQVTL